jgi:hypothetical protein
VGNKVKMNEGEDPGLIGAHYPDKVRQGLLGLQSMTSENWIRGLARLFQK